MSEPNPNDPSGLLSAAGSNNPNIIKIVNTARMELNNSFALVHSYNTDRSRYVVTLITDTLSNNAISLKPENIEPASFLDKTKIQAKLIFQTLKQQISSPQVQMELRRHYTNMQGRLGFKPEYLIYGLVALFFVSVRLFGFMKVVMATSFLLLVGGVSIPDWYSGGCDLRTCAKNFPLRWRDAIVEATGYRNISTNIATGIFIALLLFTGKVLITPTTPNYNAPKMNTPPLPKYEINTETTTSRTTQLLEEMYNFGYNDAKNEKPFGTSLPQNLNTLITDTIPSPNLDIDDYDYPPPPPPPKSRNMGMGTILSCFTLFRMLKEMATGADGQISFPLLVANIKMADPWKLGIFGMCAYKILSAFLF